MIRMTEQLAINYRESGDYGKALTLLPLLNDQLNTIQPRIEKIKCLVGSRRNFEAKNDLKNMIQALQTNKTVSQTTSMQTNKTVSQTTSMLYPNLEDDLKEINQSIKSNTINNSDVEFLFLLFDLRLKSVIHFYADDDNKKLEKLMELAEEINTDLPIQDSSLRKILKIDFLRKNFNNKVKLLEDTLESIFEISEARIEDKFNGAQTLLAYLGDIFYDENQLSKAKAVYLQKIILLRMLPMENSESWKESLGKPYYKLGLMQKRCGEYDNAEKSFADSKKYFPDYQTIEEVPESSVLRNVFSFSVFLSFFLFFYM